MTRPPCIPAEIAPNLEMHVSALAHYRAMESLLAQMARMTECNYQQAEAAVSSAMGAAHINGDRFEQIARAKVDARWLAKDADRLLALLRKVIGQAEDSIGELRGFKPSAHGEALT
ncbi:hypothetical protein HFO61_30330 [Rhizobium leguminosarum]|uniref:hypothetical protein n=1 Tax=Rhizobium leguminosarum TaxID=384 RepID=UPI001C95BAB5|nr:hypothetical protein [Rhizobium leguminosarum]MBY5551045.1 hypothetical protein [Rhizobium leguminosarum]